MKRILLVGFRVGAGNIPSRKASDLHSLPLNRTDAQVFIHLICQFHISLLIAGIPVREIVAALAPLDADELAGGFQDGKAQLRQALGHLGGKPFLLSLDAPIIALPQMDI